MKQQLGLTLRLEQQLTPQLILNLKLLQVPALELEVLVRQELEENPVLEPSDDSPEAADAPEPDEALTGIARPDGGDMPSPPAKEETTFEVSPPDEISLTELLPEDGYMPASDLPSEPGVDATELAVGPGPTVREALMPRLRSVLSDEDAGLAEVIIESLDDDGFLRMAPEEFAAIQGFEAERLRAVLYVIQRIEPGGIGCRDERAALLIQLELAEFPPSSLEFRLVADHWDLLLQRQIAKIARLCGVEVDDVRRALEKVLTLELKPARRFAGPATAYVEPDFSVVWRDGAPVAEMNEDRFPRLRLSRRYVEILRNPKAFPREQVQFAREKYQRALMFLRGIESRRRTLANLMKLILDEQREFFVEGPQHLRPATLREAAYRLNVNPSTISRATAGKYVETPFGIFPLKHFFKAGASDKSRTSIKQIIKAIIDAEDKSKPLSDDEICARLKERAITVSRRTVAKYRAELRVPGCGQRRSL